MVRTPTSHNVAQIRSLRVAPYLTSNAVQTFERRFSGLHGIKKQILKLCYFNEKRTPRKITFALSARAGIASIHKLSSDAAWAESASLLTLPFDEAR